MIRYPWEKKVWFCVVLGELYIIGSTSDAGAVNIIYGSSRGLTDNGNKVWYQSVGTIEGGSERGDRFGYSLTIGDFNNDGYDDLAIGVPEEDIGGDNDAGAVNIIYGSSRGLTDNGNKVWYEDILNIESADSEGYDRFGHSLAAGDFNGDVYDDLSVGAPDEDVRSNYNMGAVNIIYGYITGLAVP